MTFYDFKITLPTQLPYNLPNPLPNFAIQYFVTILRYPYHMVFAFPLHV